MDPDRPGVAVTTNRGGIPCDFGAIRFAPKWQITVPRSRRPCVLSDAFPIERGCLEYVIMGSQMLPTRSGSSRGRRHGRVDADESKPTACGTARLRGLVRPVGALPARDRRRLDMDRDGGRQGDLCRRPDGIATPVRQGGVPEAAVGRGLSATLRPVRESHAPGGERVRGQVTRSRIEDQRSVRHGCARGAGRDPERRGHEGRWPGPVGSRQRRERRPDPGPGLLGASGPVPRTQGRDRPGSRLLRLPEARPALSPRQGSRCRLGS